MTSCQVNCMIQRSDSRHGSNSSLPVNEEQPPLSDAKEPPVLEDSNSTDDTLNLKETIETSSSSPEDPTSSSLVITPTLPELTKQSKPTGYLQRWRYRWLGQNKVNTNEKDTHVDCCPINTAEIENQVTALCLNADNEIDLSDREESNSKVAPQISSGICSPGHDDTSKSGTRSMSTEVTVDQSKKDTKDKTDSLRSSLNKLDYMDLDCRICHGGTSMGQLVSPCYCTGTMGQMHAACLEKWLGSNGRKDCELCGYRYHLCREPRSFKEFLRNPGAPNMARHLKCDLFCFAVLTPTTMISVSLLLFAANILRWKMTWSVVGLISTAVFLIIIYIFWSVMAFTYQRKIWLKWKLANQVVRLKSTSKCYPDYQDSHQIINVSDPSVSGTQSRVRPSTLSFTSLGAQTDVETRLLGMDYNDSEPSVSPYISLDPYRLSQSLSDIRVALPSSSSSACTFSSEPSLVMNTDFSDSSSNTRLPKTKL